MEVTPEIYAWLTSWNIIDCVKNLKTKIDGGFILPSRTIELLMGGKYMDLILNSLQDAYNKFYKLKLTYTDNLEKLKPIEEDEEYISNSVKYFNWNLISEAWAHFGWNYTDEQIMAITNGDQDLWLNVLNKVYSLCNELLKRSIDPTKYGAEIGEYEGGHINNNNNINKSSIKSESTPKIINMNNRSSVATVNNSTVANRIPTTKHKMESININTLNPKKSYDQCESPLEFFIISLCKNFEVKPRQAVAWLSNNRKYLSIICNKGIEGSYEKVKLWLRDLQNNYRIISRWLKQWDDGWDIGFATIGSGLCSKDQSIVLSAAELLSQLHNELGCEWTWLTNEGIDSFIFAIIKHDSRLILLNNLFEFIKKRWPDFMIELRKKMMSDDRRKIYTFFSSIIPIMKQTNQTFFNELESFIYEMCINETDDKSFAISCISDAWYYFFPLDEHMTNTILNYYKTCVRLPKENVSSTAIAQLFSIMERFSINKNEFAPPLYKSIVFLFLENYDIEVKREFFLFNFEKFFNMYQIVPIDILWSPYLKQLKSSQNYALCDWMFLFKIIEHPRIISDELIDIIEFIWNVCLHNWIYARTANWILSLIFEKNIIQNVCTEQETININQLFINYIRTTLNLFITNLQKIEDKAVLETPYDIMGENIPEVIMNIHNEIRDANIKYREIKGKNSNCLLAMLWFYEDHDTLLLQWEEKHRIIYPPVEVVLQKEKEKLEEKEKKDYTKRSKILLDKIQANKRKNEQMKLLNSMDNVEKEIKIKHTLTQKRQRKSVMLGIIDPELNQPPNELFISPTENKNSNLSSALSMAGLNIKIKSLNDNIAKISETPKVITTKTSTQKDDVVEKFGHVLSVDKLKQLQVIKEEIKQNQKIISSHQLILPEGSIIKDSLINNSLSNSSNRSLANYITSEIYKNFVLPINWEEEENRETTAINGYNYQYRWNIKLYFRTYANEVTQTISKSNLLKMFRDKNYSKFEINLEEWTIAIRNLFGENLSEWTYEQFCKIIVQLSFLIYTKKRDTLTISECYGNLLRHFNPSKLTDATVKLNTVMKPVVDWIKQKLTNPKDEEDGYFNMPPGFKIKEKTSVVYNCRLAPHFVPIWGEGKYICYEMVEEIWFKILNSSTWEPYVKVSKYDDVEVDPGTIHNWTKAMTIAYINLDTEHEKSGVDIADCFEDGLKNWCKRRDKKGNVIIPPVERIELEEMKRYLGSENKKEDSRWKRRLEIKSKVEEFKKLREEKRREQEIKEKKDRVEKIRRIKQEIENTKAETQRKLQDIKDRKAQIEEEKRSKLWEEQSKQKLEKEQKLQERREFLTHQKRRLKEQFKMIKTQKETIWKEQFFSHPANQPLPRVKENYLEKERKYVEFEKNLNSTLRDWLNRSDIQPLIEKYTPHWRVIYDIYSRIGYNKISFFSNESIHINEFKEFLTNFTVLGLLISTEQMIYIFNKIATETRSAKDDQAYLTFDEFMVSVLYLAIFSKFANRSRKILPTDIENINELTFETFFQFLGFKIPFSKSSVEMFINDRRAMTMKNWLKLQRELKKEKVKDIKQSEYEQEVKKKSEMKIKVAKKLEQKKLEERENEKQETSKEQYGEVTTEWKQNQTIEENKISDTNKSVKMNANMSNDSANNTLSNADSRKNNRAISNSSKKRNNNIDYYDNK